MRFFSAALALFGLFGGAAQACSESTPCVVENGEYFATMPTEQDPLKGIVIFIHGFGGSGEGVFRNTGLVESVLARGYGLVAPSGMKMPDRGGGSWSFHPNLPQRRDEVAFISAVRDDVIERFDVPKESILLSGFSIGGSMTSYLACQDPDAFFAYAPVGGSFWRPHPDGCAGDVRLLHTHGWTDGTVPLEGRVLRGADIRDVGALAQGDVFHAMDIWRETNDCVHLKADRFVTEGFFWRRAWDRCLQGSALELALFPGGHVIPRGWADMALDWFEGL